jgi:SAM-dependent methyltransferase
MSVERSAQNQKPHRWFAAVWAVQTRHETESLRALRNAVVGPATGVTLEIGCGVGTNVAYYSGGATRIVASEPDPHMFRRAVTTAAASRRRIEVCTASAEKLPFADRSFDTVVSTWNFCSIGDPSAAAAEVRRVLRPGGEFRFLDHVRFGNHFGGLVQDAVTPFWTWCGGGCHPNRDVAALVRAAGLAIGELERSNVVPPIPPFVIIRPVIRGVARAG